MVNDQPTVLKRQASAQSELADLRNYLVSDEGKGLDELDRNYLGIHEACLVNLVDVCQIRLDRFALAAEQVAQVDSE